MKSNHFDTAIINFYRKVTIAFNFTKVTAKFLNVICLPKYKLPRGKESANTHLFDIDICPSTNFNCFTPKIEWSKIQTLKNQYDPKWKAKQVGWRTKLQDNGSSVTISHLYFIILLHTLVLQTPDCHVT